jgi:hypothetical protein
MMFNVCTGKVAKKIVVMKMFYTFIVQLYTLPAVRLNELPVWRHTFMVS